MAVLRFNQKMVLIHDNLGEKEGGRQEPGPQWKSMGCTKAQLAWESRKYKQGPGGSESLGNSHFGWNPRWTRQDFERRGAWEWQERKGRVRSWCWQRLRDKCSQTNGRNIEMVSKQAEFFCHGSQTTRKAQECHRRMRECGKTHCSSVAVGHGKKENLVRAYWQWKFLNCNLFLRQCNLNFSYHIIVILVI